MKLIRLPKLQQHGRICEQFNIFPIVLYGLASKESSFSLLPVLRYSDTAFR